MKKVAVIGMGVVGQGMMKIFPDAAMYDQPKDIGSRDEVNTCDLAIICVPTNALPSGQCDTHIVEDVVSWLKTPLILIKSTVEPGTTHRLIEKYDRRIVFSPEYLGESKYHTPSQYPDPKTPLSHGFLILGGHQKDCERIADIFVPRVGPATRIRIMDSIDAEIVKYAENSFFATKVIFANELREICDAFGASWHSVREGWLDDSRVGPMHTAVFKGEEGYDGKCYPKDVNAIVYATKKAGFDPLVLGAVIKANERYSKHRDGVISEGAGGQK